MMIIINFIIKSNNMQKRIKTYILNLEKDKDRRSYMELLLQPFENSILDVEFIQAIYGKKMSEAELDANFDNNIAYRKRYGRYCSPGEIGCTLSHRCAYQKLIDSSQEYALILEDDIEIKKGFVEVLQQVDSLLQTVKPQILLLSGGYVYLNKCSCKNMNIASVFDGYYTHSYLINRAAAQLILDVKASYFADDWIYLRKLGVLVQGVIPHVVNQKMDGTFNSNIWEESHVIDKFKLNFMSLLTCALNRVIKKILLNIGKQEPFC